MTPLARLFVTVSLLVPVAASPAEELDYQVTSPELQVRRLDSSPDDSLLAIRVDSTGRIFVGGRRTLFAYDLDAHGGYLPRKLLYTFPDHTWVNDIEIRGDDLYVVTVSAVYRIPGGRTQRTGLVPERLLWGVPMGHVHQCLHACAWGPEGDLYVSMGDPLWYYGDFGRPDHWGYWTMFSRPSPLPAGSEAKASASLVPVRDRWWAAQPYHGVGAVFRIRPDGTQLRSFARGLRNSCGLCFDRDGHLFTNDNDHEGLPAAYVPGRLLHVTEGAYFGWPRGWLLSKTPDRADLLPSLNEELGRFVPVLQTYHDDTFLPAAYRNSLLVARWCRRTVSVFPLEPQGSTFTAKESTLLEGRGDARPVGVCVGRGGRVFVTICYMSQNEGSPTYRSDVAVITRRDDPDSLPFQPVELTTATEDALATLVREASHSLRSAAQQELLRRTPANSSATVVAAPAVTTPSNAVELGRLVASTDRHAAQRACLAAAELATPEFLASLCSAESPAERLAGVLSVGFRLTVPPVSAPLPTDAPLAPQPEPANLVQYADEPAPLDLRTLGRVGNYTIAEHWNGRPRTAEQEQLFELLVNRLADQDDRVRLQAAHFLTLLNDARSETKIGAVLADVQDRRLNLAKLEHVKPAVWMFGPVPDEQGFQTIHPLEREPLDLTRQLVIGDQTFAWRLTNTTSPDRPLYSFRTLFGPTPKSSVYTWLRFDSPSPQRMQLLLGSEDGVKVWLNGQLAWEKDVARPLQQLDDVVPLDLIAGSNDVLVRVGMRGESGGQYLHYKQLNGVRWTVPEKPSGLSLAERLKGAAAGTEPVPATFLSVDWPTVVPQGNLTRGKQLFGAESLGCAKCHAATPTQPGGGGPSLADAGRRFTIPYLVESVLAPSHVISPVFKSSVIVTHQGQVLTGLVVGETSSQLELLQPDTKRLAIPVDEIAERRASPLSAMPQGLVKTPEELRDVLRYLLSNPRD